MYPNLDFYFTLSVFLASLILSTKLFIEWCRHRPRCKFLLAWAIGVLLLYWFQIPLILGNAGIRFTLTDFNLFFSLAFPMTFAGLALIYAGLRFVSRELDHSAFYLSAWLVLCLALFAFFSLIKDGVQTDRVSLFVTNLGFFIPIRFLILHAAWKWFRQEQAASQRFRFGLSLIMVFAFIGILGNIIAIPRILAYPPQFWYIALTNFRLLFLSQLGSLLALLVGIGLIHNSCIRSLQSRFRPSKK